MKVTLDDFFDQGINTFCDVEDGSQVYKINTDLAESYRDDPNQMRAYVMKCADLIVEDTRRQGIFKPNESPARTFTEKGETLFNNFTVRLKGKYSDDFMNAFNGIMQDAYPESKARFNYREQIFVDSSNKLALPLTIGGMVGGAMVGYEIEPVFGALSGTVVGSIAGVVSSLIASLGISEIALHTSTNKKFPLHARKDYYIQLERHIVYRDSGPPLIVIDRE